MRINIELELPEAAVVRDCIKVVAEKSPLALLAQPLFNIFNEAIKKAEQEIKDGNQEA